LLRMLQISQEVRGGHTTLLAVAFCSPEGGAATEYRSVTRRTATPRTAP
jgi:hypothetical protein